MSSNELPEPTSVLPVAGEDGDSQLAARAAYIYPPSLGARQVNLDVRRHRRRQPCVPSQRRLEVRQHRCTSFTEDGCMRQSLPGIP